MAPRGPTFKKRDVKRAIEAAKAAGVEDFRIEIGTDGKIVVVVTSKPKPDQSGDEGGNTWDTM